MQDTIGNILALEINIGSLLATEETVEDDDLNIMTLQVIFDEIDLILFLLLNQLMLRLIVIEFTCYVLKFLQSQYFLVQNA